MGRRMAIDFQSLGIAILEQAEVSVFFQRLGEVDEVAVGFGDESGIRQPRACRFRNVERSRAFGNFLHAPVGELYMNIVSHKYGTCRESESFSLLKGFGRVKLPRGKISR